MTMRRTIPGWFLAVTGLLACPCHLVITLPLAAALLSGTALGGWIAGHQGAIFVGASIYFIGALAAGATLLLAGKGVLASTAGPRQEVSSTRARSTIGVECCAPTRFPAAPADHIQEEEADTAPSGGASGIGGTEITCR
jgi:mercuric ion transport protein